MAELVDDDLDIESMFNEIVDAEDDGEEVEGLADDELAAAMEAAELLSKEGLDAQTVAAISAELEEDEAEQTYAALYAEKLLADKMEDGSITAAELAELTEGLEATELQTVRNQHVHAPCSCTSACLQLRLPVSVAKRMGCSPRSNTREKPHVWPGRPGAWALALSHCPR